MSIYTEGYERVVNGERFHIDFEKRTMKVGGDVIINNGEYDMSKELYCGEYNGLHEILRDIRASYFDYKHSLPSERSDSKRRKYFKALSVGEMTDEQLVLGSPREVAQYVLEALILCLIVKGDLIWDEDVMGKWFWQDDIDPDLVILRSWVENK
jgi:hypothetical protein